MTRFRRAQAHRRYRDLIYFKHNGAIAQTGAKRLPSAAALSPSQAQRVPEGPKSSDVAFWHEV
jgi:hypothetical protein